MAGEPLPSWTSPGPHPPHLAGQPSPAHTPGASRHPEYHTPLQEAWAATPAHTSKTCRLHSPIPTALDTRHARQGCPGQQEPSQGVPSHGVGAGPSPCQAQTLQNHDVSLGGCGEEAESTSARSPWPRGTHENQKQWDHCRERETGGLWEPREASNPDPQAGEQSGEASRRRCDVSAMESSKRRVLGQTQHTESRGKKIVDR